MPDERPSFAARCERAGTFLDCAVRASRSAGSDVVANDLARRSDVQPPPRDHRHVPVQQTLLAPWPRVPQRMYLLDLPLLGVGLRISLHQRQRLMAANIQVPVRGG